MIFWVVVQAAWWWLDINISEYHAASIFRVEVCGEWKVDTDKGQVWGGVGVRWIIVQANRMHWRKVS
jgi:hypothetical protein